MPEANATVEFIFEPGRNRSTTAPFEPLPNFIPSDLPPDLIDFQCTTIEIVKDSINETDEVFYVFLSSDGYFNILGIDAAEIHIIDGAGEINKDRLKA